MKSENIAAFIVKAAIFTVLALTIAFWGNWTAVVLTWVLAIPVTLAASFVLGMLLGAAGVDVDDIDDEHDEDDRDPEQSDRTISIRHAEILERSEAIGTYKDQQIYDWLKIKDFDGSIKKLTFKKPLSDEFESDKIGEFFILGELVYDKEDVR